MMRYQRVSRDLLQLPNGRNPMVRPAPKDDDLQSSTRVPTFNTLQGTILRPAHDQHRHQFPPPSPRRPICASAEIDAGGCSTAAQGQKDVLPQWGNRKRTRGPRAENRSPASTGDREEPPAKSRRPVRSRRTRPFDGSPLPPLYSYSRGINLRPATPVCEAETSQNRSGQERSRFENPSPSSYNKPLPLNPEMKEKHGNVANKKELPKIMISLTKKEKEEDFLHIKGSRLPQRPKRRPSKVEKSLQYVFPGMWLSDITRSRYEVREKRSSRKVAAKRRGLKGMESSMDSDSE